MSLTWQLKWLKQKHRKKRINNTSELWDKFNQTKYQYLRVQWILFNSYWSCSSVWLCWLFLPFQNTFSWHHIWWLSFCLVAYSLPLFSFVLPLPFFNVLRFLFLLTLYILRVWPYPFQWLHYYLRAYSKIIFNPELSEVLDPDTDYLLDLSLWCSTGIINL